MLPKQQQAREYWNNTAPTSTAFTVGTASDVNASGGTYLLTFLQRLPASARLAVIQGLAMILTLIVDLPQALAL